MTGGKNDWSSDCSVRRPRYRSHGDFGRKKIFHALHVMSHSRIFFFTRKPTFLAKCENNPTGVQPACSGGDTRPHLGLNAVEAPEPEDLPSPQLPLRMVDLLVLLVHVFLRQLVLLGELARPPQEAQPAVGDAGDHL